MEQQIWQRVKPDICIMTAPATIVSPEKSRGFKCDGKASHPLIQITCALRYSQRIQAGSSAYRGLASWSRRKADVITALKFPSHWRWRLYWCLMHTGLFFSMASWACHHPDMWPWECYSTSLSLSCYLADGDMFSWVGENNQDDRGEIFLRWQS